MKELPGNRFLCVLNSVCAFYAKHGRRNLQTITHLSSQLVINATTQHSIFPSLTNNNPTNLAEMSDESLIKAEKDFTEILDRELPVIDGLYTVCSAAF